MKNKLLIILTVTTVNFFAQTNYYVDKTIGNDLNNGTSLSAPWLTIQKAANTATPNSTVHIKTGTYYENVNVNVSGTIGNTIVFKNYINDIVEIDGTGTSGSTLLKITNKSYLKFENIIIQNKTVNNAQGVLVETTGTNSSTDLKFNNITIKNINWTSNATVTPTASKNAQGFIAYGRNGGITNLTITNCEVYNNILGFSEALAINGNIDGFSINSCNVHNNNNIGIDVLGHEGTCTIPALDEARNGIVANNICYQNISPYATSAGIYVDGANNIIIEKNKCYQNGWGIEIGAELDGTVQQITVKNNLIYNNEQAGMSIGGYNTATTGQVLNSSVRNNTFFQNNSLNDGTGEISITKASNCVFENNIFYTNVQNVLMSVDNIMPQANNTFNYNCWYTPNNNSNAITVNWKTFTYSTFAAYKTGTSQETNSIYSNPSLTSASLASPNFQLLSASSCIDVGNPTTIISFGETDYNGFARISNSTIDIGAFEYGSTTVGIKELYNLEFSVYPNPAISTITIVANNNLPVDIILLNNWGSIVLEEKNQNVLDISALAEGLYFIKIMQGSNSCTRKMIK